MATHKVGFHPAARADLFDLYTYIETRSGPLRAGGFVDRIEAICSALASFPDRGVARDDIAFGIRTVAMDRRVLIVFQIEGQDVIILRILYAGRDFRGDDIPV